MIGAHCLPASVPTVPLVRPVVLCILDGWGVSERMEGNAVEIGRSPMPPGGIVTTYTDITERVASAEELARANESLERRVGPYVGLP